MLVEWLGSAFKWISPLLTMGLQLIAHPEREKTTNNLHNKAAGVACFANS